MSFLEQNNEFAKAKPFVTAVIVAAGNSTRMGGVNKQFLLIDGVPVLIRTLLAFSQSDMIDEIIVAAREEDIPKMFAMIKEYKVLKEKHVRKAFLMRYGAVLRFRNTLPFTTAQGLL